MRKGCRSVAGKVKKRVGVLGLQGDFSLHRRSLLRCGCEAPVIRYPEELESCDALVLPGGESTTFIKLLHKSGLFDSIRTFARSRAVLGTCAGLIILARHVSDESVQGLNLIDLEVQRNGYGRQVDSFIAPVDIPELGGRAGFEGIFIRAPRILSLGPGVKALGRQADDIVMAANERVLAMTFHPELTSDIRIHRYFIDAYVT